MKRFIMKYYITYIGRERERKSITEPIKFIFKTVVYYKTSIFFLDLYLVK